MRNCWLILKMSICSAYCRRLQQQWYLQSVLAGWYKAPHPWRAQWSEKKLGSSRYPVWLKIRKSDIPAWWEEVRRKCTQIHCKKEDHSWRKLQHCIITTLKWLISEREDLPRNGYRGWPEASEIRPVKKEDESWWVTRNGLFICRRVPDVCDLSSTKRIYLKHTKYGIWDTKCTELQAGPLVYINHIDYMSEVWTTFTEWSTKVKTSI